VRLRHRADLTRRVTHPTLGKLEPLQLLQGMLTFE
jgi:hypothetical protein